MTIVPCHCTACKRPLACTPLALQRYGRWCPFCGAHALTAMPLQQAA
jgi:hypothetical protein